MKNLDKILEGILGDDIGELEVTFDQLFIDKANQTVKMKEGKERTAFINSIVKDLEANLKPVTNVNTQKLKSETGTWVMSRGNDYIMVFNCPRNKYMEGWEIGDYRTYTELYWSAKEIYDIWKYDNTSKMYFLSDKEPDLSKNEIKI